LLIRFSTVRDSLTVPRWAQRLGLAPMHETVQTSNVEMRPYRSLHRAVLLPELDDLRPAIREDLVRRNMTPALIQSFETGKPVTRLLPSHVRYNALLLLRWLVLVIALLGLYRALIPRPSERDALRRGIPFCPRCEYHRSGLANNAPCPECGARPPRPRVSTPTRETAPFP
jgi:hypothetical protein